MSIPSITEEDIINWLGYKDFSKGKPYAKDGVVLHMQARAQTIKAKCWGSSRKPYKVIITFNEKGIEKGNCSCPVGDGGKCKHAAALLYNWVNFPENFQNLESLESLLEKLSKEELNSLVIRMLDRHPDLDVLVKAKAKSFQSRTAKG